MKWNSNEHKHNNTTNTIPKKKEDRSREKEKTFDNSICVIQRWSWRERRKEEKEEKERFNGRWETRNAKKERKIESKDTYKNKEKSKFVTTTKRCVVENGNKTTKEEGKKGNWIQQQSLFLKKRNTGWIHFQSARLNPKKQQQQQLGTRTNCLFSWPFFYYSSIYWFRIFKNFIIANLQEEETQRRETRERGRGSFYPSLAPREYFAASDWKFS